MDILFISLFALIGALALIKLLFCFQIIQLDKDQYQRYCKTWWYKIFK